MKTLQQAQDSLLAYVKTSVRMSELSVGDFLCVPEDSSCDHPTALIVAVREFNHHGDLEVTIVYFEGSHVSTFKGGKTEPLFGIQKWPPP